MRHRHSMIFMTLTISILFLSTVRGEDWPKYRRDYLNTGHSAETGTLPNGVTTVNSGNISSLALKWSTSLGGNISGSPAVVAPGFVYIAAWNGSVYKLDAVTGTILAKRTLAPTSLCTAANNACRIAGSPMVSNGIVYIGAAKAISGTTIAATLYALKASDLSIAWSTPLTTQPGAEIWSSPVVFNGLVYVGIASHDDEPCVKGAVYAVSTSTHAIAWTFHTLDETSCPTGKNCVGAAVWSSAAVDTTNGIVYFGTGNPGSNCTPSTANATRYPDSIIALKASSPTLMGWFQAIANDKKDLDFGSSPVLTTTATQEWVGEASKNGSVYFVPRGSGGISGSARSISIGGVLIASPAIQLGASNNLYQPTGGGNFIKINQSSTGSLTNQKKTFVSSSPLFSAPLMVNDVLVFGSDDFKLHAISMTGSLLWAFPTNGRVDSGPSESNGRIYFGSNDGKLYALSIGAK
jgi:polyvinyl alcohol dehydrogenase (cytochrome)